MTYKEALKKLIDRFSIDNDVGIMSDNDYLRKQRHACAIIYREEFEAIINYFSALGVVKMKCERCDGFGYTTLYPLGISDNAIIKCPDCSQSPSPDVALEEQYKQDTGE